MMRIQPEQSPGLGRRFNPTHERTRQIEEGLFECPSLPPGAKMAYLVLLRYGVSCPQVYPSSATLAKKCALSERQIRRHLQQLVRERFIEMEVRCSGGRQTTNLFFFLWHASFDGQPSLFPKQKAKEKRKPTADSVNSGWTYMSSQISAIEGGHIRPPMPGHICPPSVLHIENLEVRTAAAAAVPGFTEPLNGKKAAAAAETPGRKPDKSTATACREPSESFPQLDAALNRIVACSRAEVAEVATAARSVDPTATDADMAAVVEFLIRPPRNGVITGGKFYSAAIRVKMDSTKYREMKAAMNPPQPRPAEMETEFATGDEFSSYAAEVLGSLSDFQRIRPRATELEYREAMESLRHEWQAGQAGQTKASTLSANC